MPVRFRGCGCCGLNAAQERGYVISMKYINIFQYILCCSRAVFYMRCAAYWSEIVLLMLHLHYLRRMCTARVRVSCPMKNAIFIPKQKKMLYEKSKKSAYWKGSHDITFPQNHRNMNITPP